MLLTVVGKEDLLFAADGQLQGGEGRDPAQGVEQVREMNPDMQGIGQVASRYAVNVCPHRRLCLLIDLNAISRPPLLPGSNRRGGKRKPKGTDQAGRLPQGGRPGKSFIH